MACQLDLNRIVLSNARKLARDYFGSSLNRKPETLRGLLAEELMISSDVSLPDVSGVIIWYSGLVWTRSMHEWLLAIHW